MRVGSVYVFGQCHLLRTQWSRRFHKALDHLEEVGLNYQSQNGVILFYSVADYFLTRLEQRSSKDVSLCQKSQPWRTKDIWGIQGML